LACVLTARQRSPTERALVQGLAWCVAAAGPAAGYLYVGDYLQGSRYLYLATAGWAIALGAAYASAAQRRSAGAVAAVLVLAMLAIAGAEQQAAISRWRRAAAQRDRLLAAAAAAIDAEHCSDASFRDVPATLDGAQVFANGFREALELPHRTRSNSKACVLRWDGTQFRRE
jgi:hypothetical protein